MRGSVQDPHHRDRPPFQLRRVNRRRACAEVIHGELFHVANDLAVSEVESGLPLADEGGICNHGEGHRSARRKLDIDDLGKFRTRGSNGTSERCATWLSQTSLSLS